MEDGKLVGPNGLIHQQIKVENSNIWNRYKEWMMEEENLLD